jgi:hypothetical protein
MRHASIKHEFNDLISGLWHAVLFMVFVIGLPVFTLAFLEYASRFLVQ